MATRTDHIRLSVHVIGRGGFLWRLEDLGARGEGGAAAEALALPMMILSQGDKVLYTNNALHRLVGHRERKLDRIVTDLPLRNGDIHMLAGTKGPVHVRAAVYESATGGAKSTSCLIWSHRWAIGRRSTRCPWRC